MGVHLIRVEGNVSLLKWGGRGLGCEMGVWPEGSACYWVGVVYVQICSVGVVCVMRQGGRVHR